MEGSRGHAKFRGLDYLLILQEVADFCPACASASADPSTITEPDLADINSRKKTLL